MESPRAAKYRQRADAIDPNLDGISAEDRATALRHQQALRHLADIEDWVSVKPHVAANHDYELVPKVAVPLPKIRSSPGRRAAKRMP